MFVILWNKIKRIYRSWTIWINGLVAIAIANLDSIASFFPSIQPYVNAGLYAKAMIALAVANLLLRFKTSKPLEAK